MIVLSITPFTSVSTWFIYLGAAIVKSVNLNFYLLGFITWVSSFRFPGLCVKCNLLPRSSTHPPQSAQRFTRGFWHQLYPASWAQHYWWSYPKWFSSSDIFRVLSHHTQSSFQTQFDIIILYFGPSGSGSIMWWFSICLRAEKGHLFSVLQKDRMTTRSVQGII